MKLTIILASIFLLNISVVAQDRIEKGTSNADTVRIESNIVVSQVAVVPANNQASDHVSESVNKTKIEETAALQVVFSEAGIFQMGPRKKRAQKWYC